MTILLDLIGYAVVFVVGVILAMIAFAVALPFVLPGADQRMIGALVLFAVAAIAATVILIRPPRRWAITARTLAVGLVLGSMAGCTGNIYQIGPALDPGNGSPAPQRR